MLTNSLTPGAKSPQTGPQPLGGQSAETPASLDGFLCFGVYSTGLAFNRVYKPLLDRLGLTYPQYIAIVALLEKDDQMVSELGEKLFLESNTLTPLIKRLESAGLVTRRRDSADERVVRVSLTDKGRAAAQESNCISADILKATGLTLPELQELQKKLVRLRDTMTAASGKTRAA
ncbi:MAG: winged helix-turn-helix transcriptional regulator [Rhodospirillaceae bacterium]|nr:winged helix-turn-helix transcriptional regulator [Rhodospirillaceae bacterium]